MFWALITWIKGMANTFVHPHSKKALRKSQAKSRLLYGIMQARFLIMPAIDSSGYVFLDCRIELGSSKV